MNKLWFGLLGIGVVYYVTHQDYAPISNRRRFIALSREYEASLGQLELRNILQQYQKYILPSFHPIAQKISKITHSIIQVSGLQDLKWEVYVIDYPLQNAFVLPGGKVFFFTGILNAADTDDRIAAVLGHEVARHSAEGITYRLVLQLLNITVRLLFEPPRIFTDFVAIYLFNLPHSRQMETEADHIGLLLMAKACYNPQAAVELWKRMKEGGPKVAEFASTHPSSESRIDFLKSHMPKALNVYHDSDCFNNSIYLKDFFSK